MGLTPDEIERRGHPVWAEIDVGALRRNTETIAGIVAPAELMGVVKGYAYGHGNPTCARVMLESGATRIGVARLAEALHLREAGVAAPIHVFTEPPPGAAATLIENDVVATVYSEAFARALSDAASERGRPATVHVKLDTGMHRVGLLAEDVPGAISLLRSLPGLEIEGAWSHLAVADVPDHPFTRKQLDLFDDLTAQIEAAGVPLRYRHIANSAGALSLPEARYDMVRCGIALYGMSPGTRLAGLPELTPVMSVKARVGMVKTVPAGEKLSYGLEYELPASADVVTVSAGYADGYDRRLSGRAEVLIGGRRFRVSGTVCMDQFMVDVGNASVEQGDVVTLLGADGDDAVTAEELADHIGTINYEVTARIPSRVPRVFVGGAGNGGVPDE
jgi:alanine racemase